MTEPRPCLHHVAGKCTATLCNWQDKKDPLLCTQGGMLKGDALSIKNEPTDITIRYPRKEFR